MASAHKLQSTTHDNQKLNSIRKIELIFNRIYTKEQTDEKWPDVWKQILCDDLMSDQIYAGVMYQGPNFNPRIDTVQIITPAEIPSDLTHESVFNRHAHTVVNDHAQSLLDKNALRDKITSQPAPISTDTTSVSEPAFMRPNNADTFKEHLGNKEHSLSRNKRSLRTTSFEFGVQSSDWNSISTDMTLSNLFQMLIDSIKYTLLNRDRSEEMFARIEISNDHARNATGLEYQLVYNKRFKTFVDQGMWEARKCL